MKGRSDLRKWNPHVSYFCSINDSIIVSTNQQVWFLKGKQVFLQNTHNNHQRGIIPSVNNDKISYTTNNTTNPGPGPWHKHLQEDERMGIKKRDITAVFECRNQTQKTTEHWLKPSVHFKYWRLIRCVTVTVIILFTFSSSVIIVPMWTQSFLTIMLICDMHTVVIWHDMAWYVVIYDIMAIIMSIPTAETVLYDIGSSYHFWCCHPLTRHGWFRHLSQVCRVLSCLKPDTLDNFRMTASCTEASCFLCVCYSQEIYKSTWKNEM